MYFGLEEAFVVLLFRRNLISISCLDKFGYCCSFGNGIVSLYLNSNIIGTGSLTDKLYKLNIKTTNGNETLHSSNYGIKRKLMDFFFKSIILGQSSAKQPLSHRISCFQICL